MSHIRTISFLFALLGATACGDRADSVTAPLPGVETPRAYLASVTGSYTQVSAGWQHSCAVSVGGAVICWGDIANGQTTVPAAAQSGVTQVSAGILHTCALGSGGGVICWGEDYYGET